MAASFQTDFQPPVASFYRESVALAVRELKGHASIEDAAQDRWIDVEADDLLAVIVENEPQAALGVERHRDSILTPIEARHVR